MLQVDVRIFPLKQAGYVSEADRGQKGCGMTHYREAIDPGPKFAVNLLLKERQPPVTVLKSMYQV